MTTRKRDVSGKKPEKLVEDPVIKRTSSECVPKNYTISLEEEKAAYARWACDYRLAYCVVKSSSKS